MADFETGVYIHGSQEKITAGRATLIEVTDLQALQHSHPYLKIALALDKKGLKTASQWKGMGVELTVIAHRGIALEKECQALLKQGFQVRVALPARLELLRDLDVGSLSGLDVFFDLMAFDLVRPIAGLRVQFHSPLFAWEGVSISQTLDFLHYHGIAEGKISLGLTDLGVMFKNVIPGLSNAGYGEPCQGDQLEQPEMSRAAISTYLKNHPAARVFYTSILGCFQSFIYNPELGDWISFDDPKTHQSKTAWARLRGLRGVFFKL